MFDRTALHSVAHTLNDAGILRYLFPLLAIVGPAVFFYFGYLGIKTKRTLFFGRTRGWWVTGTPAVLLGGLYVVVLGPMLLVLMAPVAGAMLGLW